MNAKNRKLTGLLFMFVFAMKMSISLAPLFTFLNGDTAKIVIIQLEQETNGEKESTDKSAIKEKKNFDEHLLTSFRVDHFLVQTNYLHNRENILLIQLYHPVVPTPPPNA